MSRQPKSFIAVEGPIGVGKTTLCRALARRWRARLLLEDFEENPFLQLFYRNRRAYAFQTQVFFMLSRYRQQLRLGQMDLFDKRLVSDFMFAKDRIFATVTLQEHELELYEKLADVLQEKVPEPDLVIYLQASPDVLLNRISNRGRYYERDMSRSYLQELVDAYNDYFFRSRSHPVLVVNTDRADFREEGADLEALLEAVESHAGGIESFVPQMDREI